MARRKHQKRKIIGSLTALSIVAWVVGLIVFTMGIPSDAQTPQHKTNAVVVLTGGSLRLETGLKLLSDGVAEKLFVSGVHRGVDVTELLRVFRKTPGKLDCCIALGYQADDTVGNALETADWMRENNYTSLLLVTANYHMPRSLLEFHHAMPDIKIYPNPVSPEHVKIKDWYLWPGTTALIIGEYNKMLFAPIRWVFSATKDMVF